MARIYLVEDSVTLREGLRRALEQGGHEVSAFGTAEGAFAAVRDQAPELLVTDVILPGMSGIALVEAVRERHSRLELPVVVVSSLESTDEVSAGYAAGADDYLLKPVSEAELRARVSVLLKRRSHAQADAPPEAQWSRYERIALLGRGEGATIHRARRRGDGLDVVLKAVTPNARDEVVQRLLAEAELLRELSDVPGVVRIRDVGQDGGCAYYAMRWVPGQTLRERLDQRGGLLPVRDAARVARGLGRSLAALADARVIHGDIKPSNLVLTEGKDDTVLIDFGQAYMADAPARRGGTLAYMAPELVRGHGGSPQSDLYALGVVLHETLCGRLPYDEAKGEDLAALKVEGTPPDLTPLLELDPGPGLIALVETCLDTDPAARGSAAELVKALLSYSR